MASVETPSGQEMWFLLQIVFTNGVKHLRKRRNGRLMPGTKPLNMQNMKLINQKGFCPRRNLLQKNTDPSTD